MIEIMLILQITQIQVQTTKFAYYLL